MPKAKKGQLTPQEDIFLDAYISNGFNRREAVKEAGISCGDPSSYGARILNRDHVQEELRKRLDKRKTKFFITEQEIMEGLYKEATREQSDGGTQQGRITAWVQLGKQLGMFNDKVKELEAKGKAGNTNIQIINYNNGSVPQVTKHVDVEKETQAALESIPKETLEGVRIENYSEVEDGKE